MKSGTLFVLASFSYLFPYLTLYFANFAKIRRTSCDCFFNIDEKFLRKNYDHSWF